MANSTPPKPSIPYRQIRALYDEETITVYQAYSASIALAAVKSQKLNASPDFKLGRMTWIKPSWCWMMYRSGYSYKDARQSHILALKMTHSCFLKLLNNAVVCHGQTLNAEDRKKDVRVQWDPERTPALGVLPYRSIQIGISGEMARWWVEEGIEAIEDVTTRARELCVFVDEKKERREEVRSEDVVERGLMPVEREFAVSDGVSNAEVDVLGFGDVVPFLLEDKLKQESGGYEKASAVWGPHVVRSGRLITSQNPASAAGVAKPILEALF